MKPFNRDGREFIRNSAAELLNGTVQVEAKTQPKRRRSATGSGTTKTADSQEVLVRPRTFQHYVMNLPATAISFLDAFIGLYSGQQHLFAPHTDVQLPMVHVYCFVNKEKGSVADAEICQRISEALDYDLRPGGRELRIEEVRTVAPSKQMFCASFRLPPEVLFRGYIQ